MNEKIVKLEVLDDNLIKANYFTYWADNSLVNFIKKRIKSNSIRIISTDNLHEGKETKYIVNRISEDAYKISWNAWLWGRSKIVLIEKNEFMHLLNLSPGKVRDEIVFRNFASVFGVEEYN